MLPVLWSVTDMSLSINDGNKTG